MKEEILKLQSDLQQSAYGYNVQELKGEELIEYIRWNALALEDELHEALGECGWKPWAKSAHINTLAFLREMVDAAHFFNNIWLAVSGMDPEMAAETFDELYRHKNSVNADRMGNGYDGITGKCPHCRRDLGEVDLQSAVTPDGEIKYCPCGFVTHKEIHA